MLEVKNVSYAYKTKKDKTILNNVSATFEEGIFYTIIGPSGAGKTTLLSLLAGLDTAVKGTVLCNGEDITKKGLNYHRKHLAEEADEILEIKNGAISFLSE